MNTADQLRQILERAATLRARHTFHAHTSITFADPADFNEVVRAFQVATRAEYMGAGASDPDPIYETADLWNGTAVAHLSVYRPATEEERREIERLHLRVGDVLEGRRAA